MPLMTSEFGGPMRNSKPWKKSAFVPKSNSNPPSAANFSFRASPVAAALSTRATPRSTMALASLRLMPFWRSWCAMARRVASRSSLPFQPTAVMKAREPPGHESSWGTSAMATASTAAVLPSHASRFQSGHSASAVSQLPTKLPRPWGLPSVPIRRSSPAARSTMSRKRSASTDGADRRGEPACATSGPEGAARAALSAAGACSSSSRPSRSPEAVLRESS
mmetsp:Transcript_47032/g.134591  ORF Transcript_47032/g.134591 Transcript_47032/m.134591 type:complete len:221 (+) Transcript_47032:1671-2333(+)